MPGVGASHAVAGGAALGDDGCYLDPLTALDGAEGEAVAVVVGLHLDEQQATGKQGERDAGGGGVGLNRVQVEAYKVKVLLCY